jgi:hypothetical protein
MPQKLSVKLELTPAQTLALKILVRRELPEPKVSSICMEEREPGLFKNLYDKLCEAGK